MLDYSLWKLNVQGYHLTNILLHILVALAIFWLINVLYDDWLLSLFTSLLFIVHPIHIEAVTYISGRADPLATIFILLCFIFYLKSLRLNSKTLYVPMLLSYSLALLSRENSLILPLVLLAYHYSFKQRLKSGQFLAILIVALSYIFFRFTLLKSLLPHPGISTTIIQRLPGFFAAIADYTRLLFFPFHLHMEYGNRLFNFTHPQVILGILILLTLFIYGFKQRKNNSLIFFSISWFLITLLPSSNLYPTNAYMAEHWLYLPSVGFFLIIAKGLSYLCKTRQLKTLGIVLIISLLTFYSYLTIKQNRYWRRPITLYERTLNYVTDSPGVYSSLGLAYFDIGNHKKAIASYKKAIKLDPNFEDAYNNLGFVYNTIGRYDEAIELLKKVIRINPNYVGAYNNLGNAYYALGNKKEAINLFKRALTINPNYVKAYNNLAISYDDLGQEKQAILLFKKAIELNPDYARAYSNLGSTYYEIGKEEEAVALFKKAININPNYAQAYHNLAVVYTRKKQYNLAIEYCDKAQELGFVNSTLLKALKPYRHRVEEEKE